MESEEEKESTREILRRIRRLEIKSRKMVDALFSGEYHSVFKGSGMEFNEVRPYQPGDDVRTIDWNVTARTGHPYIKLFNEEREQTVLLMLDASGSGRFGTGERFKTESAAEICATIAFSAIRNSDKVGLVIFTDKVELYIPPAKGRRHALRIIREALFFKPEGKGTDINEALRRLNATQKRRAVVFMLSDFEAEDYHKPLAAAAKRHDLIAVEVFDPAERHLPDVGLVTLEDPETGEEVLVDTGNEDFRRAFNKQTALKEETLRKLLGRSGVDHIRVRADLSPVEPLIEFFKRRERRLSRSGSLGR